MRSKPMCNMPDRIVYSLEVVSNNIGLPEMFLKVEDSLGNVIFLDPLTLAEIPAIYKRLMDNINKI